MDQKLYEATIEGNLQSLVRLIQEDALILDRNITTSYLETPLHIAAMLNHQQFVVELLKRKPELTKELDFQRSSPLHIAAAKGHVEIVKLLLQIDTDMYYVCDKNGRNPVHIAAMRGRIGVLKELLRVRSDAGRAVLMSSRDDRTTILHLCVEYGQFEALKVLIEIEDFQEMINCKDKNGNTILHLAVADKQTETTHFVLDIPGIEVNALNNSRMTAMDILMQRRRDARDLILEEYLTRAETFGARRNNSSIYARQSTAAVAQEFALPHPARLEPSKTSRKNKEKRLNNQSREWLDQKRNALMIVASLIATMAFQVGVSPPEGVWQNTNTTNSQESLTPDPYDVNYYITRLYNYLKNHSRFYTINTTAFIASLSIILLLMSGLPLKQRFFMWILMVITWVAITALALSYTTSIIIQTPSTQENSINNVIGITVLVWICLMALLFIGHTIRLIVRMIKMMLRPLTRRMRTPVPEGRV